MTQLYAFVQTGKEAQKLYRHGLNAAALQGLNSLSKGVQVVVRLQVGEGEDEAFKLREYSAEVVEVLLNDEVVVKTVGSIIDGVEAQGTIITDGPERKLRLRVALDGTIQSTPVVRPDLSKFDISRERSIPRPAIRRNARLCGYVLGKRANRLSKESARLAKAA